MRQGVIASSVGAPLNRELQSISSASHVKSVSDDTKIADTILDVQKVGRITHWQLAANS